MEKTEIRVLYEDKDALVIDKPRGFLSEASDTAPSVINGLREGRGDFLSPITRLDREVAGVMLIAKSPKAAALFSEQLSDRERFHKEYRAVVSGVPALREAVLEDLLFKDSAKNKSYVVKRMRRGVKKASLAYTVLATAEQGGAPVSLLKVVLHTGRTHQIRVQLASRRHPLLGDGRYGGDTGYPMGLLSYRLSFYLRNGSPITVTTEQYGQSPFDIFEKALDNRGFFVYNIKLRKYVLKPKNFPKIYNLFIELRKTFWAKMVNIL